MARLIVKTAKGPQEIKPQEKPVWTCMCGLSKNAPFCDKSHLKTIDEEEDVLYMYDPVTGQRSVEAVEEDCCGGGDGGCCGQGHCADKKIQQHD